MTIARETLIFLLSCLSGAGAGVIFDFFRILRVAFPTGKKMLIIEDSIFVILFAIMTFLFSVKYCNGYLRAFVLFGEMCGFFIYYFTAGQIVYRLSKAVISFLKRVIRGSYRIFISPIWRFIKYICMKIYKIFEHISQTLKTKLFGKKFHLKG